MEDPLWWLDVTPMACDDGLPSTNVTATMTAFVFAMVSSTAAVHWESHENCANLTVAAFSAGQKSFRL